MSSEKYNNCAAQQTLKSQVARIEFVTDKLRFWSSLPVFASITKHQACHLGVPMWAIDSPCGLCLAMQKLDDKADRDNHSEQLNPNNDKYWLSRGYEARPENWQELIKPFIPNFFDDENFEYEPWCSDDFDC